MQVGSGRGYEDLKNEEVLKEAKRLLLVHRQLHFARATQAEHATFDFLLVGFADRSTFLFPFL